MKFKIILSCLLILFFAFYSKATFANNSDTWQIAAEKNPKTPKNQPTPIKAPTFYESHFVNGSKYLAKKDYKNAIEEFNQSIIINPDYYLGYRGLGDAYRAMGNLKRAIEYYNQAIKIIRPMYLADKIKAAMEYEKNGNLAKAAEYYRYILGIKHEAGIQVLIGNNFIKYGDAKNALKAYQKAIEIDKWYADAHFKIGNIYYETNKLPKAVTEYETTVKLFPKDAFYNYQLGMSYLKTCKKGKKVNEEVLNNAIKYLELALKYQHDDKYLYFNLGNAYLEKGLFIHSNISKLEKEIEKEKDPKKSKDKKVLIAKNAILAINFYDKSIKIYQMAIKYKIKDSETHYNLGNAYHKQGELVQKQMEKYQNYGDELKLDATWKKAHVLYKIAAKEYRLALKNNPKYSEVYYDMGVLYYRRLNLKPDPNNLEILTKEDLNEYSTKGINYYYTYMATKSITAFRQYLILNPTAKDAPKVKTLIEEIKKEAGVGEKKK